MNKKIIWISLITLSVLLILGYLTVWLYTQRNLIAQFPQMDKLPIIKRRSIQIIAITIGAVLIAVSSLSFQTITDNKILTPSVLGFDAIYIITQTLLVALLGANSLFFANEYINFILSTILMIGIVLMMYQFILRKNKNNVVLLLLVGLIISTLASNISNFIQVFMDPENFQSITAMTTVSLNNIKENLVLISIPIMILTIFLFAKEQRYYDVMILGENQAIGLGVDFHKKTKHTLIYIAIAVSVSTALIGPLSFLGLIAVSSAREIFKTNNHRILMIASSLLSLVFILIGQLIVELLD
ncbi:MAG: iron chelate uptake ABC transporter family permease subunit, partial [Candidatus Phytoplasma sp.]|nr:iron chelate uptake ABC transporter family permease subunit [Phytoplasma sp.]